MKIVAPYILRLAGFRNVLTFNGVLAGLFVAAPAMFWVGMPPAAILAVLLIGGFTRSLRFQQCFTRQLFRFYTGREETAADDPLLRQLFFEFAQNQSQSIAGMLKALVSAPLYHSRSEAP